MDVPARTPIDWDRVGLEAIDHFKALLKIPTINPPGNERPAAEYLARVLGAEGIECRLIEAEPSRTNLVARLRGDGSKPPLLLNGHLDVVPVERESWDHDPFAAIEADGCIWGRGAIDMKNMVTMSAMSLVLLARQKKKLSRDVIFAAVADEETGAHRGSLHLVEKHPELVRSEYVLNEVGGYTMTIGGDSYYPIQVAEKGICWFELTAEGEAGHGSMPHENNAIVHLARVLQRLAAAKLPLHVTPVVRDFLRATSRSTPFPAGALQRQLVNPRFADFILGRLKRAQPLAARRVNAMLRNTVSPTLLAAGSKVNVIPSRARGTIDGRVIPGVAMQTFLDEIQTIVGKSARISVLDAHDGVTFPSQTPLYDAICASIARHDPDGIPVPYMVPAFTDSFAYARLGAVCYGFSPTKLAPGMDFTGMYHGHNERIPRDGFLWGLRVLYELLESFCG